MRATRPGFADTFARRPASWKIIAVVSLSLARRARSTWHRLSVRWQRTDGALHLLVDDPPVLHLLYWTDRKDPFAFLDPVQDVFRNDPLHLVCSFSWNMDPAKAIELLLQVDARRRRRFPRHEIHYLAGTERQLQQLEARNIPAILCNHNALVDESIFRPLQGVAKRFDAIYDARLSPFKRHQLAERIESLALVTAPSSNPREVSYAKEIRSRLAHAHWCNPLLGLDCEPLSPLDVNRCLNEAKVGLCLSEEEGAMYASMQYLLAGLPVVTTPSQGGRDVFFDPEYTLVVEPDATAVADGVRRMGARQIDSEVIRSRTLARVREHRARLIALVDRICTEEDKPRRFADDWPTVFCDKLVHFFAPLEPILQRMEEARRSG
jgi:glycosyltransferase involved in cell wall biosynthesis